MFPLVRYLVCRIKGKNQREVLYKKKWKDYLD